MDKRATREESGRIKWAPVFEQHQRMYDKKKSFVRAHRRLRAVVKSVREELTAQGIDQAALERGARALSVEGVVYAVYCRTGKSIYVGQTSRTAFRRFQEHVTKARAGEPGLLYDQMRRLGWRRFLWSGLFAAFPLVPALCSPRLADASSDM